jgi:alpha-galactosidase
MLPEGEYRGDLYDIGFDKPEAHCVTKGTNWYYAFFASQWSGKISLRGLENRAYEVVDYVNGRNLGVVHGPTGELNVSFTHSLLVEAQPER